MDQFQVSSKSVEKDCHVFDPCAKCVGLHSIPTCWRPNIQASCVRPHLPYRGEWGVRKELRAMRKEIYPLINTWAIREPEAFSRESVFQENWDGRFFFEHQTVKMREAKKKITFLWLGFRILAGFTKWVTLPWEFPGCYQACMMFSWFRNIWRRVLETKNLQRFQVLKCAIDRLHAEKMIF